MSFLTQLFAGPKTPKPVVTQGRVDQDKKDAKALAEERAKRLREQQPGIRGAIRTSPSGAVAAPGSVLKARLGAPST